ARHPRSLPAPLSLRQTAIIQARVVAVERLFRPIARAHQRSGYALQKALRQSLLPKLVELRRGDETLYRKMIERRTQILPQRNDTDARRPQIVERLLNLPLSLTETEHETALGQNARPMTLAMLEHAQCLLIAGTGIAHRMGQPPHR